MSIRNSNVIVCDFELQVQLIFIWLIIREIKSFGINEKNFNHLPVIFWVGNFYINGPNVLIKWSD